MNRIINNITLLLLTSLLLSTFIIACDSGSGNSTGSGNNGINGFMERWESSSINTYVPSDFSFINADEGYWFLGDTVSEFQECGDTPQRAEIITSNGSKTLRLTSSESLTGGCADNIWVSLFDTSTVGSLDYNKGFSIPLTNATYISFEEEGDLINPQEHGWGFNCIFPPCFDNVSLHLEDNNGNILAYVLQRYSNAVPDENNSIYREIFLNPDAKRYSRNLFSDFSTIPAFKPAGAEIKSIEFRVDEHGWAIIDNISINKNLPIMAILTDLRRVPIYNPTSQ